VATPRTFTLGKYEIIGLLGQGGNAIFYKAYHRDIDRFLAIKIFRPQTALDPQFGERFKTEARAIARLQHPYIVPLYDFGNENDIWYLATAYVQGGSLEKLITNERLSLRQVDKMLREIVSALDYAHRKGVAHKAIKPSNILVDSEGHALLADFGIFNIAGTGTIVLDTNGQGIESSHTQHEDQLGDIYALGVIAFEMLTGQPPYPARTPAEAMLLYATTPVPSVTHLREDLPPEVEAVLQRVMAKNPHERYPTATQFYEDFSRACHSDESLVEIQLGLREKEITAVNREVRERPDGPEATIVLGEQLLQAEPSPQIEQPIVESASQSKRRLLQILIVAVAMTGILAAVLLSTTPREIQTFGTLTFTTGTVAGDTVWLEVETLPSLPNGESYAAWLQNTQDGSMSRLGSLNLNDLGTGSLAYTDPDGRVLLSQFDSVIITSDQGETQTFHYQGQMDDPLSYILAQILFKSDELPAEANVPSATYGAADKPLTSLLDGAIVEATFGQLHSGLAAKAPNVGALSLHAEHTINIIKGTKDDYNGNGRGENPGRKIGIAFFLDKIDALFDSVIGNAQIATTIQSEMQDMLICTSNIRQWMDRVIELELELLQAEAITDVEPQKIESTQLATAMLEGIDLNQNNQIEMVAGECGLQQVLEHTSQLATMPITLG
jgi:serine/threonine protein kinase